MFIHFIYTRILNRSNVTCTTLLTYLFYLFFLSSVSKIFLYEKSFFFLSDETKQVLTTFTLFILV